MCNVSHAFLSVADIFRMRFQITPPGWVTTMRGVCVCVPGQVKSLEAGDRVKRTLVHSDHPGHIQVESTMPTMNGVAKVTDLKTLMQETRTDGSVSSIYLQQLTIVNENTQKSNLTERYFVPFEGVLGPTALTAGGNKKKERYYDAVQRV